MGSSAIGVDSAPSPSPAFREYTERQRLLYARRIAKTITDLEDDAALDVLAELWFGMTDEEREAIGAT